MHPLSQAEQHLQQAFDLYDTHEDFQKALEMCEMALRLDSHLTDAHNLRGILLEELNKPLNALGAYRKALKLDPDFVEAQENLQALQAELSGANPLVTIAIVQTLGQALPLKASLEAEGIKVIILNEEYIIYGQTDDLEEPSEIHLLIRKSDADAASRIIKDAPELVEDDLEFVDDDGEPIIVEEDEWLDEPHSIDIDMALEITCSWCGSHKMRQTFPIPFFPRKWKCQDCGRVLTDY